MTIAEFNRLPSDQARAALARCCGASAWVERMTARRPFVSLNHLIGIAHAFWTALSPADRREAFAQHPRIGELDLLARRFAGSAGLAAREQAAAAMAPRATLEALAEGNRAYEEKFGYIFIVFASGRSAEEMLALLRERLGHEPKTELAIAAEEQWRITRLRLDRLLGEAAGAKGREGRMSGITTHVLDTSAGCPARGVPVRLEVRRGDRGWVTLAERETDAEGRVRDLVAEGSKLDAGTYRLTFGTGAYFAAQGHGTFFPEATVVFEVREPSQHHHVPLLLSPYGYSTYRGS